MEIFFPVQKKRKMEIFSPVQKKEKNDCPACALCMTALAHQVITNSPLHKEHAPHPHPPEEEKTEYGTVKLTMFYSLRYFNYTDADVNH